MWCQASDPAIVLVRPFDADTRAVDLATGRWGFGHVALYGCELDAHAHPLVIDSCIARGVVRRRLDAMARGALYYFVPLPREAGRAAYERAIARLGRPYHYGGLFLRKPRPDMHTCSSLILECLPADMAARIKFRRHVSPNDIARSLGVPCQR